jgi:Spy/CpxP family protein refolding chaperone
MGVAKVTARGRRRAGYAANSIPLRRSGLQSTAPCSNNASAHQRRTAMKRLIMALGLTLASSMALAQPGGGPKGDARAAPGARMQQELGLTNEQVQKMREIREAGGSKEEVRAVLTPEQQAKAAELQKAKKTNRSDAAGRMKENLGLSDEQAAEIQKIQEQGGSREEIRAVLTPEQQAKFDNARKMQKGKANQMQ